MKKTSKRLADGREIIYFDSRPYAQRNATDTRDLAPPDAQPQLRFDPVRGTWVMYASHRQYRAYLPSAEECPLCPSRDGHPTEVPEHDYEVAVFENRFPALVNVPGGEHAVGAHGYSGDVWHQSLLLNEGPGSGRCEVVCYTSDHSASFAELEPQRISLLLDALVDRTSELGDMDGVEQVFCFENRGAEIGVTQPHPHGQVYAYPFIPQRAQRALAAASEYRKRYRANIYDDLLQAERSDGRRVVVSTAHWTAFVPHAARWPYELHCYPNQRVPDLGALGPGPRSQLPEVLHNIFTCFFRLFDQPAPYIAGWHQAPVRQGRDDFAMHLELFTLKRAEGKLKYLAGSESGMDAFANDVIPEAAAARLREAGAAAAGAAAAGA